jgi:hypothetical protein
MTPEQADALIQVAADFSRGNTEIVGAMRAAIAKPPRTKEEVGHYLSGNENDFENCFRCMVSLLRPFTTSAEDKYVYEIFDQWFGEERIVRHAPPELVRLFPEFLASEAEQRDEEDASPDSGQAVKRATERVRRYYVEGVRAVERAFEEAGRPLLCFDKAGGDTLDFASVEPSVADRWRGKVLGHTYRGEELGIRAPMWDVFWHHVEYALGLELGAPPAELLPGKHSTLRG